MTIPPDVPSDLILIEAEVFGGFQVFLNGTITNDKFCMSRRGQLHLSWWRLPWQARLPVSQQKVYPSETTELECGSREDTHEKTSVDHPATPGSDDRRATALGPGVSVSHPMECGFPEGASAGDVSTGEKR
jgi:hypothetical protein